MIKQAAGSRPAQGKYSTPGLQRYMQDGTPGEEYRPHSMVPRVPEVICPKTTRWDLSSLDALNGVWANCARISLRENLSGRQPRWGTEVRLGWSADVLHGLYLCQDPNPWATKTTRGDALWEEEVVEVFLDPFGDSLCYFEIEINPLNTVTDQFIRRTWTGLKKISDGIARGWSQPAAPLRTVGWQRSRFHLNLSGIVIRRAPRFGV